MCVSRVSASIFVCCARDQVCYNCYQALCVHNIQYTISYAVPSLVTDSGADDFSDCCCVALDPTAVATRNQEPAFPGHNNYKKR